MNLKLKMICPIVWIMSVVIDILYCVVDRDISFKDLKVMIASENNYFKYCWNRNY